MKHITTLILFYAVLCAAPTSQKLTIYNQGWAFIQEQYHLHHGGPGMVTVTFENLPVSTAGSSIYLESESLDVLTRQFIYRPVTLPNMLESMVGHKIRLGNYHDSGTEVGTLISYNNGLPVFDIGGDIVLSPDAEFIFPEMPGGLSAAPQLVCTGLASDESSEIALSYLAKGMSWTADYTLVTTDDGDRIESWFTIDNHTDIPYDNVSLTLVSGDIQFNEQAPTPQPKTLARSEYAMMAEAAPQTFSAGSTEDHTLFHLPGDISIPGDGSKQFLFTSAKDAEVARTYSIQHHLGWGNRGRTSEPVPITAGFRFPADELGDFHHPAGTVRVYEELPQGLVYIGSGHTPIVQKGGEFSIETGRSMDVTAEITIMNFEVSKKNYNSEIAAKFINTKNTPVTVEWLETLSGDWQISKSAPPYEKLDANTVKFLVEIAADSDTTIKFSVDIHRN